MGGEAALIGGVQESWVSKMMGISSKTAPLTYFRVSLNLTAINAWKKNKQIVEPVSRWDTADETEQYLITLLPQAPLLFYHNDANQFSLSLNGAKIIDKMDVGSVEWRWGNPYITVCLTDDRDIIFAITTAEIQGLLKNREITSNNIVRDIKNGTVLEVGDHELTLCSKTYRSIAGSQSVLYGNSLVRLSVELPLSHQPVGY